MDRGGGCGGAVRASCIGLLAWDRKKLVAWAIESARLTHHHPTAFLGAVCSALFTALALEGTVDVHEWGATLLNVLPNAKEYIKVTKREVKQNLDAFKLFKTAWLQYLKLRDLPTIVRGRNSLGPPMSPYKERPRGPKFPDDFHTVLGREHFIKEMSFRG